jgi:hypothetical protein
MTAGILAALLVVRSGGPAPVADDHSAVVVTIDGLVAKEVSASAIRQAIAADLGSPAVGDPSESATPVRGVLTISADEANLVLTYRDALGNEIHRALPLLEVSPLDCEVISLLAGNLIRNEAEQILAELSPRSPPLPARPPAPAEPAQPAAFETGIAPAVFRRPSEEMRGKRTGWFFGGLAYVSAGSATRYASGSGLFLLHGIGEHLLVGLTDVLVVPVEGQVTLSGGPLIETSSSRRQRFLPFGQVGIPLQGAWGGNRDASFGVRPFLGTGLRLWTGDRLSVAAGARLSVVASSRYAVPPTELVRGTVSMSVGLELGFRL